MILVVLVQDSWEIREILRESFSDSTEIVLLKPLKSFFTIFFSEISWKNFKIYYHKTGPQLDQQNQLQF